VSFENVPALKLREFYFLLDQFKYVKYIMSVFTSHNEKFKSKRLRAITTFRQLKKRPRSLEDLKTSIRGQAS